MLLFVILLLPFCSDHNYLSLPFFPHICSSYLWSLLQYLQSLPPHLLTTYSNLESTWFITVTPPIKFPIIKLTLTCRSFLFFYPFLYSLTSLFLHFKTLTFIPPGLWKIQVEIMKIMSAVDWRVKPAPPQWIHYLR